MPSPTWSHRLEYLLARGMEGVFQRLPENAASRLGAALGSLAHSPASIRFSTVQVNLRTAFPDADDEWVDRIARAAYLHIGREAAAMLRLARLGADQVVERTDLVGEGELRGALAEGRGALLVTGHFGNWELGAAAVAARGLPMDAVVKRQRNRLFDAHLDATRQRLGIRTINLRDAPRQVPRALRAGHVVGMVADQDARRSGIFVPFFGHAASTHRGPALFALRLRTPIFASTAERLPGAGMRYRVTLEHVPAPETGDLHTDVLQLTRALTERLENAIRASPEQYFWFHRRWKTAPPPELSAGDPGTIP